MCVLPICYPFHTERGGRDRQTDRQRQSERDCPAPDEDREPETILFIFTHVLRERPWRFLEDSPTGFIGGIRGSGRLSDSDGP